MLPNNQWELGSNYKASELKLLPSAIMQEIVCADFYMKILKNAKCSVYAETGNDYG